MGFGHRVYRAYDPRAAALRQVAEGMASMAEWLELAVAVEDIALRKLAERHPERPLKTNVEYYAAAVLQGVGLPPDLFPATFATGAPRRLDRARTGAGVCKSSDQTGRPLHRARRKGPTGSGRGPLISPTEGRQQRMTRMRLRDGTLRRHAGDATAVGRSRVGADRGPVPGSPDGADVQLSLTTVDGHPAIRFGTIVYNVGDGPIEVRAQAAQWRSAEEGLSRSSATRTAPCVASASTAPRSSTRATDTIHFHIARFIVVRLTPAPGNTYTMPERRLRKIGFCLVDSIRINPNPPPNQSPGPSVLQLWNPEQHVRAHGHLGWVGRRLRAEHGLPGHRRIRLAAGNYRLCATVNPFGLWTEKGKNYTNNTKWTDVSSSTSRTNHAAA